MLIIHSRFRLSNILGHPYYLCEQILFYMYLLGEGIQF